MHVDDLDISPSKIAETAQRIVDRAIEEARPQVVVDEDRGEVVVVGATPGTGGAIVMKSSPVAELTFTEGLGTPLLAAGRMNNVTTTKQTVSLDDSVLVLAGDTPSRTYWHAIIRAETDDGPAPSP